jgi:predicted DNA binding CopG/RHH family protein
VRGVSLQNEGYAISYQTYLKMLLHEALDNEEKKLAS